MKVLVVEDDFTCRKVLQKLLSEFGECDIAVDGQEAIEAFRSSLGGNKRYDLICMYIMMLNMNGHEALKNIRMLEEDLNIKETGKVKVIMTSALDDPKNVMHAYYKGGATAYIIKPISKKQLHEELQKLHLIEAERI